MSDIDVDFGDDVALTVQWTEPGGPPTDVHIERVDDPANPVPITGYDNLDGIGNPLRGFEIRFSSGTPTAGGPGKHRIRIRWTLKGETIGNPQTFEMHIWPREEEPDRTALQMFLRTLLGAIRDLFGR